MAKKYWGSCAPGLEFALVAELEKLEHTKVFQGPSIFGGVVFTTSLPLNEVIKLRSADNVYAFVGQFKGIPFERESAVPFVKELAINADWGPPLDLFWLWKSHASNSRWKDKGSDINSAMKGAEMDCSSLSFRVSGDRACVTMKKHGFTSMEAAAALGDGLHERFGWRGDMSFYDLEVMAWIRDDEVLLALALLERNMDKALVGLSIEANGIPPSAGDTQKVLKSSRANRAESQLYAWRSYRKELVDTSLKPSVAHALLQLCNILAGSVILDPMCGCGTIPLEAGDIFGNQVYCMAGDIAARAVDATSVNVTASRGCEILRWDASILPIRTGVIDRIVCDMPFGVRCGTSRSRDLLCPKVLKEVVRVLQLETGMAVLLGQSKAVRHEVETTLGPFLDLLQSLNIQMEGLRVEVLVMRRTQEPYQAAPRKARFAKAKCLSSSDTLFPTVAI